VWPSFVAPRESLGRQGLGSTRECRSPFSSSASEIDGRNVHVCLVRASGQPLGQSRVDSGATNLDKVDQGGASSTHPALPACTTDNVRYFKLHAGTNLSWFLNVIIESESCLKQASSNFAIMRLILLDIGCSTLHFRNSDADTDTVACLYR
jgi:hypothetical protein